MSVKLSDFGIGQVVSQEYLVGVTRAGFTLTMLGSGSSSQTGTQLYMAPELLAGNPATTRSDIYSLGGVLYQLLAGDFRRPLVSDWAKHISDPLLRDDLAHCFMGNPEERFAGASQLGRNLRAWPERTARLEREEAERAERQRLKAQTEHRQKVALGIGIVALVLVGLAIALGYGLRQAQRERERQRQMAYASDMKAAQVAVQQNNRGLTMTLLERHVPTAGQEDLRGIEWRYLWRLAHGSEVRSFPHLSFVHDLAFSPDGRLLATVDWFRAIRFWDVASGQRVREFQGGTPGMNRCIGFANDGRRFVAMGSNGVRVLDTSNWSVVTNFPAPGSGLFVVSGNGKRLVVRGSGKMDAWDLETWQHQELPGRGAACYSLAVNHAGTLVALSMGFEGSIAPAFLWDLSSNSAQRLGAPRSRPAIRITRASLRGRGLCAPPRTGPDCLRWARRTTRSRSGTSRLANRSGAFPLTRAKPSVVRTVTRPLILTYTYGILWQEHGDSHAVGVNAKCSALPCAFHPTRSSWLAATG